MDAKRAANIARFKLCIEREMNGGGYTDENEQEAFWAMATNALEKAVPKSPKEKNLDFGDKGDSLPKLRNISNREYVLAQRQTIPALPMVWPKIKRRGGVKVTIEEFEQASEIYRKYDEIEDIIERIKEAREEKLVIDERTKKDGNDHKKWWQKLRFFSLSFKGTRMVVMPHYEFAHGIEVDADPELIELIIDYFEKKKDHYKQQLSEIGGIDEH